MICSEWGGGVVVKMFRWSPLPHRRARLQISHATTWATVEAECGLVHNMIFRDLIQYFFTSHYNNPPPPHQTTASHPQNSSSHPSAPPPPSR